MAKFKNTESGTLQAAFNVQIWGRSGLRAMLDGAQKARGVSATYQV